MAINIRIPFLQITWQKPRVYIYFLKAHQWLPDEQKLNTDAHDPIKFLRENL